MTRKRAELPLTDPSIGVIGRTAAVIVVGIDGSPSSWDAFDWALGEATRLVADLIAVHVQPALEPIVASGAPYAYAAAKEAGEEAAEQLYDEADRRARELGVQVTFIRLIGDIASVLAHVAQSRKADLVVVGKSTKAVHHLAGSIGRRLIFRHDAPAIVVVP
jgi:nucleotide-binding universal stress UspA family protein